MTTWPSESKYLQQADDNVAVGSLSMNINDSGTLETAVGLIEVEGGQGIPINSTAIGADALIQATGA